MAAEAAGAVVVLSAILNRRLPGPGTVIVAQDLKFNGLMAAGDELTGTVTAREKRTGKNEIVFDCRVKNQTTDLITGSVTVVAPTRRISFMDITAPDMILRRTDAFCPADQESRNPPAGRLGRGPSLRPGFAPRPPGSGKARPGRAGARRAGREDTERGLGCGYQSCQISDCRCRTQSRGRPERPTWRRGTWSPNSCKYLGGAENAGIVLGTRVPIVLTSRADPVRARLA